MTYDELADYCKFASNEIIRQDEQIRKIEKENKELKKQLNKANDELYTLKNKYNIRLLNQISENIEPDCEDYYLVEIETKANKYDLIQTQQQEFIKYLEDEINKIKNDIFANALTNEDIDLYVLRVKLEKLEEILQKYEEIIGSDINVGSKGESDD